MFIRRNETRMPLPTGTCSDVHLIAPFARRKVFLGKEKRCSEHPACRKCRDAFTPQRSALSIPCRLPVLEGYDSTTSVTNSRRHWRKEFRHHQLPSPHKDPIKENYHTIYLTFQKSTWNLMITNSKSKARQIRKTSDLDVLAM